MNNDILHKIWSVIILPILNTKQIQHQLTSKTYQLSLYNRRSFILYSNYTPASLTLKRSRLNINLNFSYKNVVYENETLANCES